MEHNKPWDEACKQLQQEGKLEQFHVKTMSECKESMQSYIETFVTIWYVLSILFLIHFNLVVRTHWRNHTADQVTNQPRMKLEDETTV